MTTFPLSKTMDLQADLPQLVEELAVVDAVGTAGQTHEARRWEYALALRAYTIWMDTARIGGPIYDVGGHGSLFYKMLDPYQVRIIDPAGEGETLERFLHGSPRLGAAVFCLSVLEHIPGGELPRFLYHLGCLVAPGGLLVLTMDCWDRPLPERDTAHFHWMRQRIFAVSEWLGLRCWISGMDFFGEVDPIYHDHQLYGSYSIASLVLRKLD